MPSAAMANSCGTAPRESAHPDGVQDRGRMSISRRRYHVLRRGSRSKQRYKRAPLPISHSSMLSVRARDGGNARESLQSEDRSDRTQDQNPPGHGQRMRTRLEQQTGSQRGHDDVQPIDNGLIRITFPNRSSGEQRPDDMRTVIHVCWEKKCISQYVTDHCGQQRTRQVGRSSEQYADRKMERQVTDGHLVRVCVPECNAGKD